MKTGVYFIGKKTYIILSASLIKKFVKRGDEIQYCPRNIKDVSIDKKHEFTSDSMDNGSYFESMCIGSTADKSLFSNLKRQKNGLRYAHHKRIDMQVLEFRKDAKLLQLKINRLTVQQEFAKVLNLFNDPDIVVILKGTLDLFTDMFYRNETFLSVVDLKLTANVTTSSGDFCWGTPEEMDHLQAYVYMILTGRPFYYMVYDYKTNLEKLSPYKVNAKPIHYKETIETIRKAVANMIKCEMEDWKPVPGIIENIGFGRTANKCKKCPVKDCEYFNQHLEIN